MGPKHAYVFYATDRTYAIAAIVFVHRLRRLDDGERHDVVVLHLPLPAYLVDVMRSIGIRTLEVAPLGQARRAYYRHSLVKLRMLELTGYERIVLLDADALPLRSLASLFTIPLAASMAAPPAYWLDERPGWFTSSLLLVRPEPSLFTRVQKRIAGALPAGFDCDMDVLNLELGEEVERLPASLLRLDSEWEDDRRAPALGDRDEMSGETSVVHFTALGKPWSYDPSRVRRLRPHAHPFFHELRETWWRARDEAFATAPLRARLCVGLHARLCRIVRTKRLVDRLVARAAVRGARNGR